MTGIRLNSAILPLSYYNINNTNNKVIFSDGGVTRIAYLPNGQYSGSVLSEKLQSVMNLVGSQTYTVELSQPAMKLKIAASSPFRFIFAGNTAKTVLGLTTDSVLATSFTFDQPINLTGTQMMLLSIPQITTESVLFAGRESLNIIEAIPVTHDLGTVQVFQNSTQDFIDVPDQTISEITIRLLDNNNLNDIDFQGDNYQLIFDVV